MNTRTLLKGFAMGICDAIPGISGGTIAFITGIYTRLITAITHLPAFLLNPTSKKKQKQADIGFLATLGTGIIIAILLFSQIMGYLLTTYPSFVMAFFIGLILVSAIHIFTHIERHHTKAILLALIGFSIGILLIHLQQEKTAITHTYLFFNGFIASSAMILPGISGSFILLVLGSYEYVIGLLQNITQNIIPLTILTIGIITGIITMSHILKQLFKQHKSETLYFLVGLVIGSLRIPLREILNNANTHTTIEWVILSTLFFIGGTISSILLFSSKKK